MLHLQHWAYCTGPILHYTGLYSMTCRGLRVRLLTVKTKYFPGRLGKPVRGGGGGLTHPPSGPNPSSPLSHTVSICNAYIQPYMQWGGGGA